jgi:hypothetical protein
MEYDTDRASRILRTLQGDDRERRESACNDLKAAFEEALKAAGVVYRRSPYGGTTIPGRVEGESFEIVFHWEKISIRHARGGPRATNEPDPQSEPLALDYDAVDVAWKDPGGGDGLVALAEAVAARIKRT